MYAHFDFYLIYAIWDGYLIYAIWDMDIQYIKAGLRRGEPVFAMCLRVVRFRSCWFVPVLFLIGFGNLNLTLRFGAIHYF